MRRGVILFLTLLGVLILSLSSSANARRVALVIGNSSYIHAPALANPRNDASDMAQVLEQLGFAVIKGVDLDRPTLEAKIRDFAIALTGADTGLFFYAGHGLQVAGKNYIVPVDAELSTAAALDFETVQLDLIQRTMEREAQTNVIILDACRDNPLGRNLSRTLGTRSAEIIGRGLAPVEASGGTLISFSTQPGNVALDGGEGRNSPFSAALTRHIRDAGDDLSGILIKVRNDVMAATGNKQVPWEHSALRERFYFGATSATLGSPTVTRPDERSYHATFRFAGAAVGTVGADASNRSVSQSLDSGDASKLSRLMRSLMANREVQVARQGQDKASIHTVRISGNEVWLEPPVEAAPGDKLTFTLPQTLDRANLVIEASNLRELLDIVVPIPRRWLDPVKIVLKPYRYAYGREVEIVAPPRSLTEKKQADAEPADAHCYISVAISRDGQANNSNEQSLNFEYAKSGGELVFSSVADTKLRALDLINLAQGQFEARSSLQRDGVYPCANGVATISFDTAGNANNIRGKVVMHDNRPMLLGVIAPRRQAPGWVRHEASFKDAVRSLAMMMLEEIDKTYVSSQGRLAGADMLRLAGGEVLTLADFGNRKGQTRNIQMSSGGIEEKLVSAAAETQLLPLYISGGLRSGQRPVNVAPAPDETDRLWSARAGIPVDPADFQKLLDIYGELSGAPQIITVGFAVDNGDVATCQAWYKSLSQSSSRRSGRVLMVIASDLRPDTHLNLSNARGTFNTDKGSVVLDPPSSNTTYFQRCAGTSNTESVQIVTAPIRPLMDDGSGSVIDTMRSQFADLLRKVVGN